MLRTRLIFAASALACVAATGCGSPIDTPDGAVRHVLAELSENNPRAVWDGLPKRYQQDVEGLVGDFTDKLDPEIYHQCFAIVRRLAAIARDKQDLALAQLPEYLPPHEIEPFVAPLLAALQVALDSDLSSVEGLRHLDVSEFAATTGAEMMAALSRALAARGETSTQRLGDLDVELVSSAGNQATVRLSSNEHGESHEIEMTRVLGRWLPSELARGFPVTIGHLRAAIDGIPAMTDPIAREIVRARLVDIEHMVEALAAATTAEEFGEAMLIAGTPVEPR